MKMLHKNSIRYIRLLALMTTTFVTSNAMAELQKIGVVGAVNQTLSATDESNKTRTLMIGQDVYFNDTLSTDGKGNAQIIFLDKSALTVGPNSSVTVDKFVYNPADSTGEMTMRSTKGAFRFVGGALSKKQEVKINTPVGTIGIRGVISEFKGDGSKMAYLAHQGTDKPGMSFTTLDGKSTQTAIIGGQFEYKGGNVVQGTVNVTDLAKSSATLASKPGQSAGNPTPPTPDKVEKTAITGEATATDKKNNPATLNDGGDKKQGDGKTEGQGKDSGKTGDKENGQGKDGQGKDGQGTKDGGKTSANDGQGTGKTADGKPASGDNANGNSSGQNGQNNGNGTATNGNGGNGPNGAPKIATLTNDGGYVDQNGVQHSASDLATLRRDESGPNNGNNGAANANGGYVATAANGGLPANNANGTAPATNGGYAPAGGTAASGGYYTPAGVYTPNAAPVAGSNGAYAAPMTGTAASGGYYGGTAGGYAAAPAYNTATGYTAPAATGYNTYTPAYAAAPATSYYSTYTPSYTAATPAMGSYNSYGTFGVAPAAATSVFSYNTAPVGTAAYSGTNYYNAAGGYTTNTYTAATYTAPYVATNNIPAAPVYTPTTYYAPPYSNTWTTTQYGNATASGQAAFNDAIQRGVGIADAQAQGLAAFNAYISGSNTTTYTSGNYFAAPAYVTTWSNTQYGNANNAGIAAFNTAIQNGSTTSVAQAQGLAAFNNYMSSNGGTTATSGGTAYTTTLQNAQNDAASANAGQKYSMDDIAIPVGNVTSTLVKQGTMNDRDTLKSDMNTLKNNYCSTCSYVHWDVWAQVIPDSSVTTYASAQAKLVPYVHGSATQNLDTIDAVGAGVHTGTATYTGVVQSNIVDTITGTVTPHQSNFKIDVDFGARTLSNLRNTSAGNGIGTNGMAVGTYNVTNNGAIAVSATGTASFSNALTVTGGSGSATGSISGALFGGAAQNIGGNFKIDDATSNAKAAGVYIGAK